MIAKPVLSILLVSIVCSTAPSLAAPGQMHGSSRHLYGRVMEEFKHRDYQAALAGFQLP